MRFQITATVRGSMDMDTHETDSIDTALRVFDCFTIGAERIAIYDHVMLCEIIEGDRYLVEEYRRWVKDLRRLPRFHALLAERYPEAHPEIRGF